jgi:hypothetical protein
VKHRALAVPDEGYSSSEWYAPTVVPCGLSVGRNALMFEFCTASIAEPTTAISGFSYFMVFTSFPRCSTFRLAKTLFMLPLDSNPSGRIERHQFFLGWVAGKQATLHEAPQPGFEQECSLDG